MSSHPIDKTSSVGIKTLSTILVGGLLTVFIYWVGANLANDVQFVVILVSIITAATLWIILSGLNSRRTIIIAIPLLILAPAIQLSDSFPIRLPVTTLYDILILIIGGMLILRAILGRGKRLVIPGRKFYFVLIALIPMTLLSMAYGSIILQIPLSKGDWFEMVKFALYICAFYLGSQTIIKKGSLHFVSKIFVVTLVISAVFGFAQTLNLWDFQLFGNSFYAAPRHATGAAMEKHFSILQTRATSTILNPNEYGLLLATGLSVTLGLLAGRRTRGIQLIILPGFIVLLLLGIISTGSRTAFVGTIAITIYYVTILLVPRWGLIPKKARGNLIKRGTIITLVIMSSLSLIFISGSSLPLIGPIIEKRISRLNAAIDWQIDASIQTRIDNLSLIPIQLKRSPILGDGPSEGASAEKVRVLGSAVADSEWILILLRNGLLGIILYIAFWITAFKLALYTIRSPILEVSIFGHSTLGILIINLVGSITAVSLFDLRRMTITCLILGLCVAATRLSKSNQLKSRSLRDV